MRHFHVFMIYRHMCVTSLTYYNESVCICASWTFSPPECVIKQRENSLHVIIKNAQIHYENEEENRLRCRFVEQKLSACEFTATLMFIIIFMTTRFETFLHDAIIKMQLRVM